MTEGHAERLEAALGSKYRIERRLGGGGTASVYLTENIKHERSRGHGLEAPGFHD